MNYDPTMSYNRFVSGPENFASAGAASQPATLTELMMVCGYGATPVEDVKPFLRGLWDWAVATETQLDTPPILAEGLHRNGIIDDSEYSSFLSSRPSDSS